MEEKFLYYPIKPMKINQVFGNDPTYYKRFKDRYGNPLKGHNGLDLYASHGQPVYAAHDGMIRYNVDTHKGESMIIVAKGIQTYYMHLIGTSDPAFPSPLPADGIWRPVKAGDLLGYANNTGAPYESNGDHLHFGFYPLDEHGDYSEPANGYGGAVDPSAHFNGFYAEDAQKLLGYYQSTIVALKAILALIGGHN